MIRTVAWTVLVLASLGCVAPCCQAAPSANDTLSFEVPGAERNFEGWSGGPDGTLFRDSSIVHGGRFSARIERGPSSPQKFSALTRAIPARFSGDTLVLRGWLRTEGVTEFAGLWLREDAASGSVQFDNMESRKLSGTTPWTQYRITLPYSRKAKSIVLGALLAGQGKAYVDDLELLVDGRPLSEAPVRVVELAGAQKDHEFDSGSRIEIDRLDARQTQNLALLGKVWGFVKVHHPRVASGKLDWDYELFRVMPSVLAAKDATQARVALASWLDRVGEPAACAPCATLPDSAQLKPRLGWIRDRSRLGPRLLTRLQRIYERRGTDVEPYYAAQFAGIGNPDFSNEAAYSKPPLPDAGFRLLALFRFWNMVEYWFPDRDLIPGDWDGVLREFIPRLVAARTPDDYHLALMALAARVHDGHANLWGSIEERPPRGACQLPVSLRYVEGKFVVAAFADTVLGPASGLRIGDVIQALDGARVDSMATASAEFYGASNDATRMNSIAWSLTQGPGGPCRVRGMRGAQPFELTASRDSTMRMDWRATFHDLPGEAFRLLDPDVAYLKLSSVVAADAESYIRKAAGTRCLVIDIRNYPSEFVVFALGQHLVDHPTDFVRFTRGDLANPGAFFWTRPLSIEPMEPHYAGRIVILVDEVSMSSAEYTAMAFRAAPNAFVVGSPTAGADGNVSRIPLPGGTSALFSGIGVFYPDKRPTQQIGIVPDLVVRPTIEGIRAGRDEVLEAALKQVLGREVPVPRW